ncbi:9659_t:CDS:1, partial [Acaulospora colombiana]
MRSFTSILIPLAGTFLSSVKAAPTGDPTEILDPTGLKYASLHKRATWTPAQGGCWSDNVDHVRALEHNGGNANDMTPEKCQSLCESAG